MRNSKYDTILQRSVLLISLLLCGTAALSQSTDVQQTPGAGKVLVHRSLVGKYSASISTKTAPKVF